MIVHDDIKGMSNKLGKIPNCGYELLGYFPLPEDAWWTEYYRPLETRIKELYMKYSNAPEALKPPRKYQKEIDAVRMNSRDSGSAFYIMQKKTF